MKLQHLCPRRWRAWLFLSLAILSVGCGGSDPEQMMDATALLERYERDRRRHDPLHFSEVDLGKYSVTQRCEPSIYHIRFHLHAVIPDALVDQFSQLKETHGERVRAEVREAAQRCEIEQFNDPALGWLKSEMINSINRVVRAPMLRDVVFSEFSFERG